MRWTEPASLLLPAPLPDLHPLVAQTLVRRGFNTPGTALPFLDPLVYSPTPAMQFPGMNTAVERVERAIRAHEPICIWGDFDVDGQTATTLLFQTLLALGADVTYHIPVRASESHGVNIPVLKEILDSGVRLILTCDTGITAHQAVEYARMRRVEVIITDHHNFPEILPQAIAVINPKFLPPKNPLVTLSGVGVAFKLAESLVARAPSTHFSLDSTLDLVAMGLVADLAILTGDARYLVQKGLIVLRNTHRLGLQVMMDIANLVPDNLSEEHISFELAPRLNALGRLGNANPAVELLTTTNFSRARLLAMQVENYNSQRQLLCNQVMHAAEAQLRADPTLLMKPGLVLGYPTWPGGIVGIVASRLVERYHKPTILFSTPTNEPARGSARSVEGIDITAAIAAQKDLLLNFGGHPMAAGLSLDQEKLPEFSRRFSLTVGKMVGQAIAAETEIDIDAWLDLADINLGLVTALENLAPFGPGNEKLILAAHRLILRSSTKIGHNKDHLILSIADELGSSQSVLWWNGADEKLPEGKFDLAFTLRAADWKGKRNVQMEFVDFRVIETSVEIISPKLEIVDFRAEKYPRSMLLNFRNQPSTVVWAEADAKKEVDGKDRNELEPANNLVIWTIPPSPDVLLGVLKTVNPRIVTLVCAHPKLDCADPFVERLIGLLKYAITYREGKVTYAALAAATAQRQITVEQGLNWLVSRGKITLMHQEGNLLWVGAGKTINDLGGAARIWIEVQALLSETLAYRAHFKRTDKDSLLT